MEWRIGCGPMIKSGGKGGRSEGKRQERDDEATGAWKGGGKS